MTEALLSYAINAAWQAPLLLLGGFALVRLGGLGPRASNRAWLACLALAVVLPAARIDAGALARPAGPTVIAEAAPPPALHGASVQYPPPPAAAPATARTPTLGFALDGGLAGLALAALATAVAIGLVRLVAGWLGVRRLAREAEVAVVPDGLRADLESLAAAHGARSPEVRQHPDLSSPVVVGALRPVILAPVGFLARPEAQLRPALLHEFAHVLRRDYAVNLACELVSLPLCWHPAAHIIKGQIRRSRELACDAMAASAMQSEAAYARGLVALARALAAAALNSAKPTTPAMAVGLFGKPLLEDRLMHLIGPKRTLHPALKTAGLTGGALIAGGAAGAAMLLHVSAAVAQPTPPPTPPVLAAHAAPSAPAAPAAPPAPLAPPAPPAPPADLAELPPLPPPPEPPAPGGDHATIVISQDHGAHAHHWRSADGRSFTIMNNDPKELTAEERARFEKTYADATVRSRDARVMADSPEFRTRIIKIRKHAGEARLAALRALDDPKVKAEIADAERQSRVEVIRVMNDPKIKIEFAEARRAAAQSGDEARRAQIEVDRVLSDPKIKREIAEAVRVTSSPEYQKAQKDLIAAAKRIQELDRAEQK